MAVAFSISFSVDANAQGFLKGLADRAKDIIKEKVSDKVERSVDNAMDNVIDGKKSAKKKSGNNDNSEEPSSAEYEESRHEDTDNSVSDEGGNIVQVDLTDWIELAGIAEGGIPQFALVPESRERKIFEGFEDKLSGNLHEQMLRRKLNEENKAVIREMVKRAKSYSIGNRFYSEVFFPRKGDLIVVSISQTPVGDSQGVYGEWGAIDKNGSVIIPLEHFQFIRDASWMDALLFVDKRGGKVGAYHLNGKLRIPFKYESIQPGKSKHKNWFITYENGKNVLYDENMNKKLIADNIEIVPGTINGKDDTYIYTYDGAGSAKVYKNYDENLNRIIEQ